MRRRSNTIALCLTATAFATLSALGCGSDTPAPPGPECMALTGYTPTTTTPLSFATHVYPILARTTGAESCSQAAACHGIPPFPLDLAGSKTLQYLFAPENIAMAKASMMMPAVNAPSMQRVVASNVGSSFLAYKISGAAGLACVNSKCQSGASVGMAPCGDPMPTTGTLPAADRTTILDWIATGALD
jgi:hypothetical protein